jgi:hypothetical protein
MLPAADGNMPSLPSMDVFPSGNNYLYHLNSFKTP